MLKEKFINFSEFPLVFWQIIEIIFQFACLFGEEGTLQEIKGSSQRH